MKPIRLGVIGLGLIWLRTHKPILEGLKDKFEPVAFCDINEERRAAVAQEFPDATVVADYQSLLQMPEVEAVLILTPLILNAPTALAALRAGKDVFMEKPIARSVAEGQELIATARQQGKRLFVTEQFVYRTMGEKLSVLITSGEIGELLMWEWVQHLEADPAKGAMRYDTTPWRKAGNFPLGTLFDGGIHLIAGLSQVFGVPETVSASGKQLRPEYGEYDHVVMMFQYSNGVTGILSHSSYLPPLQNHFYVYGTQGVITVAWERLVVKKQAQPERIIELPSENVYQNMWQALVKAFEEGKEPYYTPERALVDVAILETVDKAIKAGQRLRIIQ